MAESLHRLVLIAVALLLTTTGKLRAAESPMESLSGDYRYCTVCHGAGALGNIAIQAPALAGIEPWYLRSRLRAYREQHLGRDFTSDPAGTEMRAVAREVADARFAAIIAYIAQFKAGQPEVTLVGNVANGRRLYAAHCAVCHGERGEGSELLQAPRLTRLNDWYVVVAYNKYRQQLRGLSPEDAYSAQMQVLAASLPPDFAIHDVASFLSASNATGNRRRSRQ